MELGTWVTGTHCVSWASHGTCASRLEGGLSGPGWLEDTGNLSGQQRPGSPGAAEEQGPADTLNLNFQPLNHEAYTPEALSHLSLGACYSTPRGEGILQEKLDQGSEGEGQASR